MTPAEILALSDERNRQTRRLLNAERAAYLAGYAACRADAQREADQAWAAQPIQRPKLGPTLAELELLRWGPGGREHFADPRPSDRTPAAKGRAA